MVSLEQLQAFAEKHRRTKFDLNNPYGCLAAKCAGKVMASYTDFRDGEKVDPRFAQMSRYVYYKSFTGSKLVKAIDSLLAGVHPHQVAEEMVE
jgi:hypothetical protein